MTIEALREELAEIESSAASWRRRANEAQRQVDIHLGHIERINMWIKKLTEAQPTDDSTETDPIPVLP